MSQVMRAWRWRRGMESIYTIVHDQCPIIFQRIWNIDVISYISLLINKRIDKASEIVRNIFFAKEEILCFFSERCRDENFNSCSTISHVHSSFPWSYFSHYYDWESNDSSFSMIFCMQISSLPVILKNVTLFIRISVWKTMYHIKLETDFFSDGRKMNSSSRYILRTDRLLALIFNDFSISYRRYFSPMIYDRRRSNTSLKSCRNSLES